MSTPRLSLVMGKGPTAPEGSEISLPVSEGANVHLHLHLGEMASPVAEVVKRPLGGWGGLIVGVGLVVAFAGGYQLGHRSAPDETPNVRRMPVVGSFTPPEPAMPNIEATGLPAIQRQLGTPPQIIPPIRAPQQPGVTTSAPSAMPAAPGQSRNAFGLEN